MSEAQYGPGSLVRARGREWIVLSGSDAEVLRVRPLSGSEQDQAFIHVGLESEPVTDAHFPPPSAAQEASHDAALLLRDALLLSLRRGAGPFRSFGQIAVEPRAYQLVPLLMALKLDPVRLLIADDVGVGKTIEAALIAREMYDRGEIERFTVLCPPHLVDQWVTELEERFHFRPAAVTAANAKRLEGEIPGISLFEHFPHTVVSLDYIKSEKRRNDFLRACPEFVIVDEAHTCAAASAGRHQRYELLKGLTASETRHMVLLTATPHSGDDDAFYRLLGLLDPVFRGLADATAQQRDTLRARLARHFVQRRRPDIAEWQEGHLFARRESKELTYSLTGDWDRFFNAVLDYCAGVVAADGDAPIQPDALTTRQRLNFWGTLALMRCAASSPAAAVLALRTRAGFDDGADEREALLDRLFDGASDALPDDDLEPAVGNDDPALAALIVQAEKLAGQGGDPKLKLLTTQLSTLVADGFNPVVFCRYIATAHYLGRHLTGKFKGVEVAVVTGELVADERRERVDRLDGSEKRILIATDCLSEGINLQGLFNAVVHYDLSWNPTRHEQREGRVDRFGQDSKIVRTTLIYGENNPVDGAVLEVILRKAEVIRKQLGVPVPLPDEGRTLTQALMTAVLMRRRQHSPRVEGKQQPLFRDFEAARAIDAAWERAAMSAKQSHTVFAQHRMKPADVLPEWKKTLSLLGGEQDVHRFTERALSRLGSGLQPLREGFKAPLEALPEDVRDRLKSEGIGGNMLLDFEYPPASRCRHVHRSHPLVSVLAEGLLERTLTADPQGGRAHLGTLGRVGCWVSDAVGVRTVVALLRLRHQLVHTRARKTSVMLVEECGAVAWSGADGVMCAEGDEALALLSPPPVADPPAAARARVVAQALGELPSRLDDHISALARRRSSALLADHERVRESARGRGLYEVTPSLPPDVIALFVLLPRVT